jgi:hypothetical protein
MLEIGYTYKSHPDNDWGIKILEFDPHCKKAVFQYVSLGCPLDTPRLGETEIKSVQVVEALYPVLVAASDA